MRLAKLSGSFFETTCPLLTPPSTTYLQGVVGGEADEAEKQFRSAAGKMMGDLNTSGDAPFGGEVQLDSQVGIGCRLS